MLETLLDQIAGELINISIDPIENIYKILLCSKYLNTSEWSEIFFINVWNSMKYSSLMSLLNLFGCIDQRKIKCQLQIYFNKYLRNTFSFEQSQTMDC